jgi:hypothetical protein
LIPYAISSSYTLESPSFARSKLKRFDFASAKHASARITVGWMICLCPRYGAKASFDAQSMMVGSPPGEAVRGPSSSSTALDPEPTAQTDPFRTFASVRSG